MKVELGDIKLIRREEEDKRVKLVCSVLDIKITKRRRLVEQRILGFNGSFFQDLGRDSIIVDFEGIIYGPEAKGEVEKIWNLFKRGEPVRFYSDITGISEISKVVIEDLRVNDTSGKVSRYKYYMRLREYIEPPEPEEEKAKPLKNVEVVISGSEGEYRVKTNAMGEFIKERLPPGKYTIKILHKLYEDLVGKFEIKKKGGK